MYIGEIIKDYRSKNKISQRAFASRTSLSASYINTLEKVYNPKTNKPYSVTMDVASEIASAMCISIEELLSKLNDTQESTSPAPKQFYMCPVYSKILDKYLNWTKECIEGRIPIAPTLLGITNPEEHFFLHINDESMNKIIRNDAYALIHKQNTVKNGEIAIVLVAGYEATLRKFSKQGNFVLLEPMSDDNDFQIQVYDKTTPIQILGKYIGKFEINKNENF